LAVVPPPGFNTKIMYYDFYKSKRYAHLMGEYCTIFRADIILRKYALE